MAAAMMGTRVATAVVGDRRRGGGRSSMMDDDSEPHVYRSLSVIVPVFNERNTVAEIIRRMRAVTLPADLELEVVVVDDGSSDGTDKILGALEDSTVRVISHPV